MKTMIIKSNNGNHSGHSRTWTEIDHFRFDDNKASEAKQRMLDIAFVIDDNVIEMDGLPFHTDSEEIVFNPAIESSFMDGLTTYAIITEEDDIDSIFDGGSYGYAPEFVLNFFKK